MKAKTSVPAARILAGLSGLLLLLAVWALAVQPEDKVGSWSYPPLKSSVVPLGPNGTPMPVPASDHAVVFIFADGEKECSLLKVDKRADDYLVVRGVARLAEGLGCIGSPGAAYGIALAASPEPHELTVQYLDGTGLYGIEVTPKWVKITLMKGDDVAPPTKPGGWDRDALRWSKTD